MVQHSFSPALSHLLMSSLRYILYWKIGWSPLCCALCIARYADGPMCTLCSAFSYRPQEIARLCVSTCTCHPLHRSPRGSRAHPPPWWRPQKSCHPPPWWSSPPVFAYQSVLVIYSLGLFSVCVFLHMFCTCLRLVSMFVLQVTMVCHCVTWETRSKLLWLQVCCPASLLESTHNRSKLHSLNLWTTGHVSMGPLLRAGGSTTHPLHYAPIPIEKLH